MPKKKSTRTAYKNEKNKELYDQVLLMLPKGTKDRLKEISASMNISMNDYINRLIKADIEADHKPDELHQMLSRWQIKEKYHPMIKSASYTKTGGYFIKLKSGYISDYSGTDEIMVKSTNDLKHIMQYTHPVRTETEMQGLDSKTYEQCLRWQMPKHLIPNVESVSKHEIRFRDGKTLHFESVSELRYLWKSL